MSSLKSIDEHFEKAFRLAYFINGSKQKAISIVIGAMNKLEVAATAQFKRLYYTPARRNASDTAKAESHRTKVSLSELHLLQRLIYIESEPYEREREQLLDQDAPDEHEMLIHFIKHLVKMTIKRNSFYVTLGISRLLHNYSTAETMEIYNVAVQDPERVKDDYYYRSRKGRLIQEMKERFGALINVSRGQRGEERFQTHDSPEEFVELVFECLDQFSPWNTSCPVPVEFDPIENEIRSLAFSSNHDEDKVEINRIHAILHPDCYGRVTKALRLELPARRLDIPYFFLPGGKNDMKRNGKQHRRHIQPLNIDELAAIKGTLDKQSARRKTTHAGLLSIIVDGNERARLDIKRANSINLKIEDGDELIEVRALKEGRETLLASHLLGASEIVDAGATLTSEIILEGGQKLSFVISPLIPGPADAIHAGLTISYEETSWLPAAILYTRRMWLRLSDAFNLKDGRARLPLKPVLAGLLLMLCAGALVLFIARGFRQAKPAPVELAQARPQESTNASQAPLPPSTPANVNASVQDQGKPQDISNTRGTTASKVLSGPVIKSAPARVERGTRALQLPGSSRELRQRSTSTSTDSRASTGNPVPGDGMPLGTGLRSENDATRALSPASAVTALAGVKKIYLDISGDTRLVQQLSRLISQNLRVGQRLSTTENKDEADAALKLNIREMPARKTAGGDERKQSAGAGAGTNGGVEIETLSTIVTVRLVNEDGAVIWPIKNRKPKGVYDGTLPNVTRRIAGDLLEDIRKARMK
ncbi:MAG TPA: hypothetical protein VGO91_08995 [Pyrinomonadaceae bacterium]|jgi:hypothetical protein|nr:hypothetical protein [Pyrinomonadaceae bacterium]